MAGPAKPGGEDFENFEPPQVSGGLRPARHSWFGFQNLPKSSGPPPEMFIFFILGAISLLHTFGLVKSANSVTSLGFLDRFFATSGI